jgi:hypothetical protein
MELEVSNIIALILITLVIIFVVSTIIVYIGSQMRNQIALKIQETFRKFFSSMIFPYNICEAYSGKHVSLQDFQVILQAVAQGRCGDVHANVSLSFSLSKNDITKLAKSTGIIQDETLIFYNIAEPIGTGGIIIEGESGYYPLKIYDVVEIWQAGKPTPDLFINVTIKGCDPTDDVCDIMCVYKKVCDPVCDDGKQHNIPCNLACIDINNNNRVDVEDANYRIENNKCNPDCYSARVNPFKAYDPGCVWRSHIKNGELYDEVCDPNSNGVIDGICDPDCYKSKNICDPDCNGTAHVGNPNNLNDTKCFICDKICNGWCSPSCKTEKKFDPDCVGECCGNGICNKTVGESCLPVKEGGCFQDCPGAGTTCEDLKMVCCPKEISSDFSGCTNRLDLLEGQPCFCPSQCNKTSTCSVGHCCPFGRFWNGTACSLSSDVLIVSLKSNLKKVYSDSQIQQLENKIKDYTNALTQDSLGGVFLYLDDEQVKDIIGNKVEHPDLWGEIDGILDSLIPKMKAKYLLIIGGDKIVVQPPVGSSTGSDDPYGDTDKDGRYIPDVPVGRIPDPSNGDLDVMLTALDTASKLHRSGGLDLSNYVAPIMGCGGYDNRNWNSGKCFCSYVLGIQSCAGKCGCLSLSETSGKDFVVILAHGPGPLKEDLLEGGCISATSSDIPGLDVTDAVWMCMSCGGGHIKKKEQRSDSIMMEFLGNKGAVYFGGTDNNQGAVQSGCPVPGGDECVGTLYSLIAKKYSAGKRIGDAYKEGKSEYMNGGYNCQQGTDLQSHIIVLYGDPSLKINRIW